MNNFRSCNTASCPAPRPCKWSDWTDWAGCDVTDKYQMVRRRSVDEPPKDLTQLPCNGTTRETRGCDYAASKAKVDCELGQWSQWDTCTKSGGGGQKTRNRV